MNEASRYLLALAKQKIQAYTNHPLAKAAIITGSTATGEADYYSDIEMFIYYDQLPSKEELQLARQRNQGSEPIRIFDGVSEGRFGEFYFIDGVQFQVGNSTIASCEREIAAVLKDLDVDSPRQKILSGILDSIPVCGDDLILQWKQKIADYPDALARAMVKKYLDFFPIWALRSHLASRDTTLFQHQIRLEIGQNLLGVLAGLNRVYYSTFQFKRMRKFIESLNISPNNLYARIEQIFHQEPLSASSEMQVLVRETVDLIERYMPDIDTSKVRVALDRQEHAWSPISDEE